MSIVSKSDVLDKIVSLAALASSFYSSDIELFQEVKRNLEVGRITETQVDEIERIVAQADRGSHTTFTSIVHR